MRSFGVNISASTSAADPSSFVGEYDVFLSFCGQDTRNCFTDFLYIYLQGAGIRTFKDNENLHVGEEIGPELLKAIMDSKISIPIFSKNYASSKWCLFELVQMVKCQEKGAQMIFPIFYDVSPYDVRYQSRSYKKAFRQHKKKRYDEKTIQGWKDALTKVGQLKGLELKKETGGREGELVKMVVEKVLLALKKNYTHVPDNLVGMEHHEEEMMGLLDVDFNGVQIVGVHGMGGIGKTTITKVIYNKLVDHFEFCCFLEDVREKSQHHNGLVDLQNQFVSTISKGNFSKIFDVEEGIKIINDMVGRKKVLMVLDDIDEKFQFDKLVGNCDWFGSGSRIIVTTRNKDILDSLEAIYQKKGQLEVYKGYEPKLMNFDHSLQLFSKCAFMRDFPLEGYDILSKQVVSTATGLPLVLVTMGSLLFGKEDKDLWVEILKKLEKNPHDKVMGKLRISFDALEYEQKQIFIDIACLFIGEEIVNPFHMWDDCEFYPRNGIKVLVLRSLVKVGDNNRLWMHDHIRDLGRQIVREENLSEPSEHSRLWRHKEAWELLERRVMSNKLKVLILSFCHLLTRAPHLSAFTTLERLELFHCTSLCRLDGLEELESLKYLNASSCLALDSLPDLSKLTMLQTLNVSFCNKLTEIQGLDRLACLEHLDIRGCESLNNLPDVSNLKKLRKLVISSYDMLINIQGLHGLESLEHLDTHECKCIEKRFDENIQEWKEALTKIGKLNGLELEKETGRRQGELVKIVVEEVLSKLKKNYKHVPENMVGMDSHIEEMERLLNIDCNGLRIIGIIGMGGLGKTTIAKVIYNKVCELFECHCFLEDVRENSNSKSVVKLQEQLVSHILKRDSKFDDVHQGIDKIKGAIHGKEVLIVLDDVDTKFQIDKLAGNPSWYKAGSRIIITTRDEAVLLAHEMTCQNEALHELYRCYRPKLMGKDLALQLFSKHAFMRDFPPEGYIALAMEVVSSAGGLPLVLVTLGSSLSIEKDIVSWQDKLNKLKAMTPQEVLGRLRISYDALDNVQKQIFLDIACLFSGEDKTNPCYMWDDCKFYPREGINALVRRSLITVIDDNKLWMHDRLRELGEQIIREENEVELGEWSRSWRSEDSWNILEGHSGTTKNVQLLCLPKYLREQRRLGGEDFRKLPNIRYLSMGAIDLDGDFKNLLQNLRWLHWQRFPANCAPTNLHMKNLVVLDLDDSHFSDDWGGWSQIKMSNKLKVLNLSHCHGFTRIPHLSTAFPTLERLEIFHCASLCRLDGLEELTMLQTLEVKFCEKLTEIQGLDRLASLKCLDISGCESLNSLPDLSNFESLTIFNSSSCRKLVEIQGLDRLASLKCLDISRCESLNSLPDLSNLESLTIFKSSYCNKLVEIQGLDRLASLEHLYISGCESLNSLPDLSNLKSLTLFESSECEKLVEIQGLGRLESLKDLGISNCESLNSLPDLSNLESLIGFDSSWCEKLVEIQGLDRLKSLIILDISNCESLNSFPDLSNLESLTIFDSSGCKKLVEIQGLDRLTSLERLSISGCESLNSLPDLSNLKSLTTFDSARCMKLVEIQGLDRLASLERLSISGCESLNSLPELSNLESLTTFDSARCKKLVEIQGLDRLASLERLDISGCESLNSLPDLSNLESLTRFDSSCCEKLVEIQGLDRLASLERLDISGCKSLNSLPDLSNLESLTRFDSSWCEKLVEIQGLDRLESLERLYIICCESLNSLPDLSNLKSLTRFYSSGCKKLVEIQGLDRLASLERLDISGCESLNSLPDLSNLKKLRKLVISSCDKLIKIQGLHGLESLRHLNMYGCKSIKNLSDFSNLTNLEELDVSFCAKLTELRGLEELKFLNQLRITGCELLANLPCLPSTRIIKDSEDSYPDEDEPPDYLSDWSYMSI